ncbi:MAG: ribosome biogenesis GTPase Der [Tissierellia bacterium]|nr:ribosome biogenesis GTPase Der [Tissierellia bacterium]
MKNSVVCIVGRPNVGKSTLFNKIVGHRTAITGDTPGVTRDRLYAIGHWQKHQFTVIDTGGLDPKDEDVFMNRIIQQAEIAMDTADVIVFLVDGAEGVTPTDLEIANLLRRTRKPVILAVNKLDTKRTRENAYEFYELGFGEPMLISAEQSLGIGDLLDEMVGYFKDEDESEEDDGLISVSFIGKPNVGKSSLLNYITGENRSIVTDIPGTTRDAVDFFFSYGNESFRLIDTAGLRRKRNITENIERYSVVRTLSAVDRSDVCVLVIDALEGVTEQDSKIIGYAHDEGKSLIIAVNKWDLVEKDNSTVREFEIEIRTKLAFVPYVPIIFISAKTGQRVNKLLDKVIEVYHASHYRIPTARLNELLSDAVLMNQPPSDKGKRCKIYYMTQVSVAPPQFTVFVNSKELMHYSYLRYLENRIRENVPYEGVPIQMNVKEKND